MSWTLTRQKLTGKTIRLPSFGKATSGKSWESHASRQKSSLIPADVFARQYNTLPASMGGNKTPILD
jgi:hypothetical protein